jgi:hypothetical protein
MLACLDPTISTLNYKFCGEKYRRLTKWFFDGKPKEQIFEFGIPIEMPDQIGVDLVNVA